jgi:two-component system sensor histidine kinase BaeS
MILGSLRARLIGAMALVLLATVAALALHARLVLRREFHRFLVKQEGQPAAEAAAIQAHYRAHGSWRGVEPVLARLYAEEGHQTLIVSPGGTVLARYPREGAEYAVAAPPEGGITLTRRAEGHTESIRLPAPAARVTDAEGRFVSDVYLMPAGGRMGLPRQSFPASVERWLLLGLAVALLAALGISATLVRRLLAPVDALTASARALASGRLDVRVDARGGDEVAELARSFNAMAEALQRNESARRSMVSDLAHELRTPLASMRARAEAAQDGLVATDGRFLASLEEDLSSLSRLVDDLQQLALAQAGRLRLDLTDVPLEAVVRRVVEAVLPEAERRGIALRTEVPGHPVARADADRLVQVLRNLVVNAVAHARGAVEVAVAEQPGQIEVRVADDGEGVPQEAAERVFDRFFRADPSRSRSTGGTGLGLAIAQELVHLHEGTIRLENRPGAGATFFFTVPRP